ncbi:MAG: hypothetical protein JSS95_11005 [Acidobacteria bacterium]|nr:hypothetical protein [Acidobacteriota bacterium]
MRVRVIVFLFLVGLLPLHAQFSNFPQVQGERVDAETALSRALKTSSVTEGGKPFHAVLVIGAPESSYSGRLEVWWAAAKKYKTIVTSPAFSQTRIVNGGQVMETNSGDYYPRWLENFVDAIIDPVPMLANFQGRGGAVMLGPQITNSCLRRDDRPGGITDQMTWGMLCFTGSEPRLESVLTMNYSVRFEDWKSFGKQKIARTYKTSVLDYKEIVAHLTTLEELRDVSEEMFAVTAPTPQEQQIRTAFVSTLKEESLIEDAPKIDWPPVREGKTEGYMIVYARTDRTGQVRETAKHNSDQPGLESFGMEQALRYKFKPLLVGGVAVQMEMPLVLHFTSKIADPLPTLRGQELVKQISGCEAILVTKLPPEGSATPTHISVNEEGKLTGEGYGPKVDPGLPAVLVTGSLFYCHFAPLVRNGAVTYYHGDLLVNH